MNCKFLLIPLVVFLSWLHFSNLDVGLPSKQRTEQVFGDRLQELIPKMIEQRKAYYKLNDDLLKSDKPLAESQNAIKSRWDVPMGSEIPFDIKLDRMRNYALGSDWSDEQVTLSNVRPWPGESGYYGLVYYWTCGAFLMVGKLCGLVTLNRDVAYYFLHPDECARLYMIVRAVGGVAIIASVLCLALMIPRGIWIAGSLAVMPLTVTLSHLAKAHLLGMFFQTLAICFAYKTMEGKKKYFYWTAVALGLSVGCVFTNVIGGFLILLVEWDGHFWRINKIFPCPKAWKALAIFFAISIFTNLHLLIHWHALVRYMQANMIYFNGSHCMNVKEYLQGFPLVMVGAFVIGSIVSIIDKNKFALVCLAQCLIFFFANLLTTRHTPIDARMLPYMAVVCVSFANYLVLPFLIFCLLPLMQTRQKIVDVRGMDNFGAWINSNIQKGSHVPAPDGGFSPYDTPAIRFMDYKMIAIPRRKP